MKVACVENFLVGNSGKKWENWLLLHQILGELYK